jgi:hypothetical protein
MQIVFCVTVMQETPSGTFSRLVQTFIIFLFVYLTTPPKLCLFLKGKYLEEYMVLNMMGNGKVGRIEN